jgi:hypothetical protein
MNYYMQLITQGGTYSGQVQSPFFISTSPAPTPLGPSSLHFRHCTFLEKFIKLHLQQDGKGISSWTIKSNMTDLKSKE